ncbi:hypothetical protein GCM10009841_31990 [Microlunatus panaciterrae]|uniref:Uncharacterized protein n=1 Tax=Microlunatus panaciterrae TaxID=400768 RepID=A0ABS2RH44_9ACTN|nr:hypothetical protein [Microlunatus panaciterrae]MBM7797857.1 hypothetical protein [Microlunatus panaciterrae]
MNFLKRLFGKDEESGEDLPITLDVERRKAQLGRLEKALDALVDAMSEDPTQLSNPGWKGRIAEYGRLAGEAMTQRRSVPSRESLLDLCFEIRPVFSGEIPAGMEWIGPLQDEVVAAARELQELLPGERPN